MEKISDKFYNWASILEWDTREQVRQLSTMPFIYPHVALMPDAHLGRGCAIGSVIPTKGAIIPAAVGVDIGCGMMALQTQFTLDQIDRNNLDKLHQAISSAVPLSAGNYNDKIRSSAAHRIKKLELMDGAEQAWEASQKTPWTKQLGTLGSGNHFIEVSFDENGSIWLFLHSGSRGVGNRLAQKHIKIAQDLCANESLPNKDLAYLTEGTQEFSDYIRDLRWAQRFAYLNREEMMARVQECFEEYVDEDVDVLEAVNCHHNYTDQIQLPDIYGGANVWLSRKGAIDANLGKTGLIPGSMGDKSYVVEGLGNPEALWSAPHGAGRLLSRSKAKGKFTMEDLTEKMQGIAWGNSKAFLDEHPQAYKPVDQVMEDASDLVKIKHTFRQIANIKGN